jgi:hypothetical protein
MILGKLYGYHFAINIDFKKKMFEQWKAQKRAAVLYLDGSKEKADAMDFSEAEFLMLTTDVRHYHITEPVLDLSQKIKLKDNDNYKWLIPIKDQVSQYTFRDSFIIFQKKGDRIVALASTKYKVSEKEDYIHWDMFNMDLTNAILNIEKHSDYAKNSYKLLLQLLSFIELSDIEEITIKPKTQHGFGSKKDPNTLYNENKFPITVVNSRWAQKVYRPGEFMVITHPRWQPKGPRDNPYYELIWIPTYSKKGMTISAGKERNSQ